MHRWSRPAWATGLLVAQVSLSLVLVVAAGLFLRTFAGLVRRPLGFDADRVIIANVNASGTTVEPARRTPLLLELVDAAASVPGAASAGGSIVRPLSENGVSMSLISTAGTETWPESERVVATHFVTPGWLTAYGVPLKTGRGIDSNDTPAAPPVTVINEAFARKYLAGRDPLGEWIANPAGRRKTIVGVVADSAYSSVRDALPPTMYVPLMQEDFPFPLNGISIGVRAASGSPDGLTRSLDAAFMNVDSHVSFNFRPLARQVGAAINQERVVAMLAAFFGATALLLTGLGLYGVTAYIVSRRRGEVGLRMALGALPPNVVWLVTRRVAAALATGVAVGAVASLWASRFIAALVWGLPPRDPVTFLVGALTLMAVGVIAAWIPASRAARADPSTTLRQE